MRFKSINILISLIIFSLFFPNNIFSRVMVCESFDNRYNYCRIKNNGNIRIINQLSSTRCIRGQNWGYDRNGIWVDQGCRAEFEVGFDYYDHGWGGYGLIVCESQNYEYNYCPAYTRDGVRLFRQLSNEDCIKGRSWGYDRNGVWVDRGCRAEFEIGSGHFGKWPRDWHRRNHDDNFDEISAAIGIIGGLALLGAIFGSEEKNPPAFSHPPYYPNEQYNKKENVPYWIIGDFKGYSVFYNTEIEISISPSGIIDGFLWDKKIYGVYRNGQLILDSMTYSLEYLSDGFIAKQIGDQNNQIYFKRSR